MPQAWASCNNCQFSNNGRLWVFWKHSIWSCTKLAKSSQQITLMAVNKGSIQCIFTFIYGKNWVSYGNLWVELCNISDAYSNMSWSVLGDFNVARFMNEKLGGKPLPIHKLQDFNDCVYLTAPSLISQAQEAH